MSVEFNTSNILQLTDSSCVIPGAIKIDSKSYDVEIHGITSDYLVQLPDQAKIIELVQEIFKAPIESLIKENNSLSTNNLFLSSDNSYYEKAGKRTYLPRFTYESSNWVKFGGPEFKIKHAIDFFCHYVFKSRVEISFNRN
jgi:hypothetical protein